MKTILKSADIIQALELLSEKLKQVDVKGEICIYGGAALLLAFDAREATRDIDVVFSNPQILRDAAKSVAEELEIDKDWINDGVKGFISHAEDIVSDGMPQFSNLRIVRPSAEYLLAMKCMSARAQEVALEGDFKDAQFLMNHLNIKNAHEVFEIVEKYFFKKQIVPKTQYFIEEAFAELELSKPIENKLLAKEVKNEI